VAAANPSTAYILIIDEINRANLAKVFGELLLPAGVPGLLHQPAVLAGQGVHASAEPVHHRTMNTADGPSRASTPPCGALLVRRLDPHPPVQGLARQVAFLSIIFRTSPPDSWTNSKPSLEDADAAIGPSYLMKLSIYARPDGLERVWQYEIMPLLEDLFYGQRDLAEAYGAGEPA